MFGSLLDRVRALFGRRGPPYPYRGPTDYHYRGSGRSFYPGDVLPKPPRAGGRVLNGKHSEITPVSFKTHQAKQ